MSDTASLAPAQRRFLAAGLAGSFLVTLSAQFISANIADVQGGTGLSADEASWLTTVYTMASFAGIVASGTLIRAFGPSRYAAANALVFGAMALAAAGGGPLWLLITFRALQGLAAGGFGPLAFVAVFMVMGGPRLPLGLVLLAFVLLFPTTLGPIVSGFVQDAFGWRSLFLIQAGIGGALALAALAWLPRPPVNRAALKADWAALILLSIGLAALMLVLSQGTRRFWFENAVVTWAAVAALGAFAGFVFLTRVSPLPVIAPALLLNRRFGLPITLNLVFRAGFALITWLIPQFLAVTQGYRPLQIAELMLWAAVPQALALPLVWWLLHRLDSRVVMAGGLLLCGLGAALLMDGTSLVGGEQFRWALLLFGSGQLLFLAPDLLIGASTLKPADLPTASIAFNATTTGGTTLGVALVSHFATEREKFHSSFLTEAVSLYAAAPAERIAAMANALGSRLADEAGAARQAVALLAAAVRREAWVLSFNDAFLVLAGVLILGALGVIAIGASKPLPRRAPATGDLP